MMLSPLSLLGANLFLAGFVILRLRMTCRLRSIPAHLFGEQILRFLSIAELCRIDIAICNISLREQWWQGHKDYTMRDSSLSVCLSHSLSPKQKYEIMNDDHVSWMQKRQVISSNMQVNTASISQSAFSLLLSLPQTIGLELTSLTLICFASHLMDHLEPLLTLHQLTNLKLHGFTLPHFYSDNPEGWSGFRQIINNNKNLETIYLNNSLVLYFREALQGARGLTNLTFDLAFAYPGYITGDDLAPLRPQLLSLSLSGAMNDLIFGFFTARTSLTRVYLSYDSGAPLTDGCIRVIALNCPFLEMIGLDGHDAETGVTDDAIEYLSQVCPLLKHVVLHRLPGLTSVSSEALLRNCKNLRRLVCSSLDEEYTVSRSLELTAQGRSVKVGADILEYSFLVDFVSLVEREDLSEIV